MHTSAQLQCDARRSTADASDKCELCGRPRAAVSNQLLDTSRSCCSSSSVCAACGQPDLDTATLVINDGNVNLDCKHAHSLPQSLSQSRVVARCQDSRCELNVTGRCDRCCCHAHPQLVADAVSLANQSNHCCPPADTANRLCAPIGDSTNSLHCANVLEMDAGSLDHALCDQPYSAEHADDLALPPLNDFIARISSTELFDEAPMRAKFIGPYLVTCRLGSGSYATVKECVDARSMQRFAVKILSYRKGRKIPTFEQDIRSEIRLLRRLHHPNVIELFDVLEKRKPDNLKQYLVLTYCIADMQRILEYARGHKFPEYQAQRYFRQTCDGLEYLHSIGVIHKDIKPGNLLIAPDDSVRITDFGVAELLSEFAPDDRIKRSAGTIAFQPPEVFNCGEDETYPGYKLDIWSLGVTLYCVTSGTLPFKISSDPGGMFRLMAIIGQAEWSLPEGLSAQLGDLITHMMDRDVSTRFSLEQVKRSDWFVAQLECVGDYVNPNIGTLRDCSMSQTEMFTELDGTCTVKRNALDTVCRMAALKYVDALEGATNRQTQANQGVDTFRQSSSSAVLESKSHTTTSSIPLDVDGDVNSSAMDSTSFRRVLTDEDVEKQLGVSEHKTKQLYAHMNIKDDELDEDTEALSFTIRTTPDYQDEADTDSTRDVQVTTHGGELNNVSECNDAGRQVDTHVNGNAVIASESPLHANGLNHPAEAELTEAQLQADGASKKCRQKKSPRMLPFCKLS